MGGQKKRSAEIHILKIPKADSEHPGSLCSFRPCGEKERKETKLKRIRNQIEIKKEIS